MINHGFWLTAPVFLFLFVLKGLTSARRRSPASTRRERSWPRTPLSNSAAPPAPSGLVPSRGAAAVNLPFGRGGAASTTNPSPLTQTAVDPPLQSGRAIPEEVLIVDPRASLTPAEFVDRKFISLLKGNYRSPYSRPVYD
jgi:hypothetical protein